MEEKDKLHEKLRIGKIAQIYGIPVSTLHWWEKEGLISPAHNKENNYSEYDVGEIFAKLGDIIFYRNIDLPIKDIKKLRTCPRDVIRGVFESNREKLLEKIEDYKEKLKTIEQKLAFMDELDGADPDLFIRREIPFRRAFEIHPLYSKELIKKYLADLNRFVIVGELSENGEVREYNGIAVDDDEDPEEDLIFETDPAAEYLMTYCRIESVSRLKIDSADFLEKLRQRGYAARKYICQFLINLCDERGVLYDYYRIWFQVAPLP